MRSDSENRYQLSRRNDCWAIEFSAMASPCEILIKTERASEADKAASLAFLETQRIEQKYSRYREDNIIYRINSSEGREVEIDEETVHLLEFAGHCHDLSEGLFDITSGVLRRAWRFKGEEEEPDQNQIEALLELVGWERVELRGARFKMRPGMEIDLGGIGKEYAVDRTAESVWNGLRKPVMVNYGGDIRAFSGDADETWVIGIEKPDRDEDVEGVIEFRRGGVATSGGSRRYCLVKGEKLGHILNPFTGWPVRGAPSSVTVVAGECTTAGFLSTLAMLQGQDAEEFLKLQGVKFHCIRAAIPAKSS